MNSCIGSGAPFLYSEVNACTSQVTPNTVHTQDTGLVAYFRRYLLQKAMSVFVWDLPKTWSANYFLYCLYCWGYLAVVNTDKFGVIPQGCGLMGYDIFYQPTNAVITNPLLSGILQPRIGKECTIIRLQPDYGSIMDLVNFYAEEMALCSQTLSVNLLNSKLSYVFTANGKPAAESLKKMFDAVSSGEPAVFVDKNLMQADGSRSWAPFSQNVGQNYIVDRILSDMRKIESMFDTDIGIPNANTDKKERLVTDEVNANNVETFSKTALWLDELKKAVDETNKMFGLNISVDWRVPPEEMQGGEIDEVDTNDTRLI